MRFLFLLAFIMASVHLRAQTKLTGSIQDTSTKQWLSNAVVALINPKDSQLVRFSRTNATGHFELDRLQPGSYILLASYPKFADFSDVVQLKDGENNFGTISLTLRSKLMEAVVVRSAGAVRIKGDTTEFVADSFVVRDGATVEDLLKKFPGFQVNSKGEITAQGRKVEKVLVDGEEFFGDDPTIATKNLSARQVDKVQLFDNKSEQSALTGISTGQEGKTLNIKLKEEAKKGAFGRVEGGTDFRRFSDAKAMANKFRKKEKISVFGTHSTIDGGALSWGDRRRLGIENNEEFEEAEGFYISYGDNDDIFSNWNIQGLPTATSAGGLYANKWKEEKQAVNLNYRYNRLAITNKNSLLQQSNLPEGTTYNQQSGFDQSLAQQHSATGRWDWKVDSLTSFKLVIDAQNRRANTANELRSEFKRADESIGNTSEQFRSAESERMKWTNALTWKQLFRKKDRQMLTTLRLNSTDDSQNGINVSLLRFFSSPTQSRDSALDQRRSFDGNSLTYGIKTTIVEPLSDKLHLIGEFSFNRNNAHSYRNTFNKGQEGKYNVLDTLFSNNFDMNATVQNSTLRFRYKYKKLQLALGGGAAFTTLKLFNLDSSTQSRYRFTNFLPSLTFGWQFKPQTGFHLNYNSSTIQPAINQLQPIRDNNDPLRIFVGNPALQVGINHSISVNFWQSKTLKQQYLGGGGQLNILDNAVSYNNSFDPSTGRQTFTPINVDGNYNWFLWSYFARGFGENKWSINASINGNGTRNISFINGAQNIATNTQITFNPELSRSKENKYEISISPSVGYSWASASLQRFSNNFVLYGGRFRGMYTFPGKLRLESDVNWEVQGLIPAFGTRLSIVRWNGRLSRGFFKNEQLRVAVVANDILNQNIGFTRSLASTFVTESRFDRVAQYFLLRFEWSFNKSGGGQP